MPSLLSVNVGLQRNVPWQGRTVYTGVWKHPAQGPQLVRRLNIDGDGQGDLNGHGGEQRAVLVYQIQSYEHWQQYLGRDDFGYGQFGENLTVDGLADNEVCIGDRYRIGEAEFEVTQPRVTCYRVGLRLGEPQMAALLVSHHRPGFYMRVISEGHIEAGDDIVRTRRGPGELSVADTDALLYLPRPDIAKLRLALQIPALSPGWQDSFRELFAASSASTVSASTVSASTGPAWPGFRALRVTKVVRESTTVSSIHLATADGGELPAVQAGQYLTLRIPGAGRPAPVRSYSLSSPAAAGTYRISVKRDAHGVASSYLDDKLRAGDVLDAAAPRGEFVLDASTCPVLLISAGIGVTPVLAMLYELAAGHNARDIWWLHGARGPQEHPFAAEARTLLESMPHAREYVFYSAATPQERDRAGARAGRLTAGKLAELKIPATASAYVCGPASFMADMEQALTAAGIGASSIHSELFGALPSINPGLTEATRIPPHQPADPSATGALVTFARSGIATRFPVSQRSVLDLADACDVPTRWSCRTGVCHTCSTPLLSGSISYSPAPLEPPAEGEVLICSARPETDIVLDM
jgi:ferredoxin-NADP reductase/MOSC domain-containing protein YiiM